MSDTPKNTLPLTGTPADDQRPAPRMTEEQMLNTAAAQTDRMCAAGLVVPVDPDVAEHMGCFEEDALSLEDALESRFDLEAGDTEDPQTDDGGDHG